MITGRRGEVIVPETGLLSLSIPAAATVHAVVGVSRSAAAISTTVGQARGGTPKRVQADLKQQPFTGMGPFQFGSQIAAARHQLRISGSCRLSAAAGLYATRGPSGTG